MASTREPTSGEMTVVDERLAELRQTFPGPSWSDNYEHEYDLLGFAFYEGCSERGCREIMARAAPFAVGNSLVKRHGFTWVIVQSGESWHHGVVHPLIREPIDLQSLEDGGWYRPYSDDEPPRPGEATMESHETIELAVKWKQVAGVDAPLPEGDLDVLHKQIRHVQVFGYTAGRPAH